jgi:RNA polymerase sigma factor (sigma-70 family)
MPFLLDTSLSLLERLRLAADPAAWERLIDLYTPLVRDTLRGRVQPADVDDLTQEVLRAVVRGLPQFRHDLRRGAFRRWLRTITVNQVRSFWRARRARPDAGAGDAEGHLERLEDPESDLSRRWDEEHDRHVIRRLLELIECEFEPTTWQAFRRLVLDGEPTAAVAAAVGITPNAARIAKSRVLGRLRREADGLID